MKLYKYSAVDENCLSGLINSQLWFSDPRSFNDPFDVDLDTYLKQNCLQLIEKSQKIDKATKKNVDAMITRDKAESDIFFNSVGLLCLTKNKGESNTLMWSHYGNSHKGVMFEFETDTDDEFFCILYNVQYTKYSHVNYQNNLEKCLRKKTPDACDNLIKKAVFIPSMFLRKATQWEYEQEVRLIKADIKNNQRLFNYAPNCLTGIYFGLKTTEEHKQTIKQIIQLKGLKNTKLYQAEKVEDSFNLVYTEICD